MTPRSFSYAAGVAFTAAGAMCWSMGGALVRLTDGLDTWQIIFFRSFIMLVCMTVWLSFRFGGKLPGLIRSAGANAVVAGIAMGTAGLTFVAAMLYTTVAQAVFMVGVAPFVSALLGMWILRERIGAVTWIAMTVALAGMALILYGNDSGGAVIGSVLAVYSVFCASVYTVSLRWGQKSEMTVAILWNGVYLVTIAALVMLLPMGLRAETGLQSFAVGWWNFLWLCVMGAVQLSAGLVLFTLGSRSVPAAQLSLITLIEPTLSPVWVFLVTTWLAEPEIPPVWTFIGGAVIVLAIVIQALASATRDRTKNARRLRRSEPAFDNP
jgi:drug/metabolite transporter, DME family